MSAAKHVTAASDSRQTAELNFHERYQDCGYDPDLMDGNLDAPARIATGSTYCLREVGADRNSPAPALAFREGVEA